MTNISYNKLWESEFDNIGSKRDKLQDMNINQSKLEVHDSYRKDEKLTKNFEPSKNENVINRAYIDEKLLQKTVTYQYWKKVSTNSNYITTNNL